MNQIIYPESIEHNFINYKNNVRKVIRIYKILFIFSIVVLLFFISYFFCCYYHLLKNEKISKKLLAVYDIQQLYSSATPTHLPDIISASGDVAHILGIIEIDKINLRYPILSKTSTEFLKIAPCKFYGNVLNKEGNFCIASHNYNNNDLFSNLYLLEIDDIIKIYNLNRKSCILQSL